MKKQPFNPEDKVAAAKWIYNTNQNNWMAIGFPADFSLEKRYNELKKLLEKLNADTRNSVLGPMIYSDLQQRLWQNRTTLQQILKKTMKARNYKWPKGWGPASNAPQNISNTDGDETHEHIRTHRGRPSGLLPYEEYNYERNDNEPIYSRNRFEQYEQNRQQQAPPPARRRNTRRRI